MTKQALHSEKCDECGDVLLCRNCSQPKKQGTKFSKWLRKQTGLMSSQFSVAHNLDYIWYNYKFNWLITIEEKTNNGKISTSQKQTHNLIRQMLEYASGREYDISFGRNKRRAVIKYKGHYLVQFENTCPDDSNWIKINNEKCQTSHLKSLLMLGEF